jgi:hypothetical protein
MQTKVINLIRKNIYMLYTAERRASENCNKHEQRHFKHYLSTDVKDR